MSKVDVFIRAYDRVPLLRGAMSSLCHERWRLQPDINLHTLHPINELQCRSFHIDSKRHAEELATTPIYVVADDDCLIIGANFIYEGVGTMMMHPAYGILTATSISDGEFQKSWVRTAPVDKDSVGGVAFVRKGILSDFDPCTADKVDETICNEFKRKGYKCGVLPWVKFNHIGAHFSISTPGLWAAPAEGTIHRQGS